MTISDVSKKYGISADTLRYYERIGLIPPVTRDAVGNRDFTEEDCNWVYFAKAMRSAGISIEAMIDYTRMFQQGTDTVAARKKLLMEQYEKLTEKIGEMQQIQERLRNKIDGYEERILKYEEDKLRR